jgi:hypothetical protein
MGSALRIRRSRNDCVFQGPTIFVLLIAIDLRLAHHNTKFLIAQ